MGITIGSTIVPWYMHFSALRGSVGMLRCIQSDGAGHRKTKWQTDNQPIAVSYRGAVKRYRRNKVESG